MIAAQGFGLQTALAQNGEDVFVEALVDNPAPFVGQQITYIARFYRLQALADLSFPYTPPDFEGFWRVNIEPFPFTQTAQQLKGRQYIISEIRTALYATRPGEIIIGPAQIGLPEEVFQTGGRLNANMVSVQAQPLPGEAPPGFNGAVGQFEMSATLDRQSASVGEPIILRLFVNGTGNVEQLASPELPALDGMQVFVNPGSYTALQQNGRITGQRVYEWLLVFDRPGARTLPPVNLVYFDPDSLTYRTVSTTPVQIEITPGEGGAMALPPTEAVVEADRIRPLKPVVSPPARGSIDPNTVFWLLWLIPPFSAAASGIWMRRQQQRQRDRAKIRQKEALTRARQSLHKAAALPAEAAYRQITAAFWAYFGDKLDLSPGQQRLDDVQPVMAARDVPDAISAQVMLCLEQAAQGLYAPGGGVNVQRLAQQAAAALERLDAAWGTA
ncbi:MAG: BatD family protein [Chloroflexi bacterium]|nr:BatD family protein [Chloroflexota bacterium]